MYIAASFPFFVYIERNYFMKKGDIFEGKVIRIEFPNKGIIDIEGQKVIVKKYASPLIKRNEIKSKEDFLKSSSHPR